MSYRYDPPPPHPMLRLLAAAMTALTMCVLVALPAKLEAAKGAPNALAQKSLWSATPLPRTVGAQPVDAAEQEGYDAYGRACVARAAPDDAGSMSTGTCRIGTGMLANTLLGVDGTHPVHGATCPPSRQMM